MQFDREYSPQPSEAELPLFGCDDEKQCSCCAEVAETVQDKELKRVRGKTAGLIMEFFDCHQVGETFHAEDLFKFVAARCDVAPASVDRVMRDMRRRGWVNYEVVNRSASLYRKIV